MLLQLTTYLIDGTHDYIEIYQEIGDLSDLLMELTPWPVDDRRHLVSSSQHCEDWVLVGLPRGWRMLRGRSVASGDKLVCHDAAPCATSQILAYFATHRFVAAAALVWVTVVLAELQLDFKEWKICRMARQRLDELRKDGIIG
jgi:hypothetical protein